MSSLTFKTNSISASEVQSAPHASDFSHIFLMYRPNILTHPSLQFCNLTLAKILQEQCDKIILKKIFKFILCNIFDSQCC